MKRLWDALFEPMAYVFVLPMIWLNIGLQLLDVFTNRSVDYMVASGLITIAYAGGVFVAWLHPRAGSER